MMPEEDAQSRGDRWRRSCVLLAVRSLPMTIRRPSILLALVPILPVIATVTAGRNASWNA